MMHMWGGGYGPGFSGFGAGGIFGLITTLLFFAILVVGAIFLIRALNRSGGFGMAYTGQPTALDVLQERYAKGEIDTEEYEERRRALTAGGRAERPERK